LVARKFMKWAHAQPTSILNLKEASASKGTEIRRIYKVVNVLDGLGLMKKTGVTEVQKCEEFEPTQHIELGKLEEDEDKLDALIEQVESRCNAQYEDTKPAYINHKDFMTARQRKDQTVLVIKPTADTLMETLDQTQAQAQAQLKLQLYIRSMAEVGVYICVDQKDDQGKRAVSRWIPRRWWTP
jgi:hypothetical protein